MKKLKLGDFVATRANCEGNKTKKAVGKVVTLFGGTLLLVRPDKDSWLAKSQPEYIKHGLARHDFEVEKVDIPKDISVSDFEKSLNEEKLAEDNTLPYPAHHNKDAKVASPNKTRRHE